MADVADKKVELSEFRKGDGFSYVYEGKIGAGQTAYIKMPPVSANKRGVNDIGWQCNGEISIYATMATHPETTPLWQEVQDNYLLNKTISFLKVINEGTDECDICIRVILY